MSQHVTEKPFLSDVLSSSYRLQILNSQRKGVKKLLKRDLQTGKAPDFGLHKESEFLFTQEITISLYRSFDTRVDDAEFKQFLTDMGCSKLFLVL